MYPLCLKKSPLNDCNQLRPIMRKFERTVCKQELSSALKSKIKYDQFAYKEGHSTTMALIKCQHHWLSSLDKGTDYVKSLSFDFSKTSHTKW